MDSPLELYHSCISETILAPSFLLFGKNFNIMSCLLVLPYTMEITNYKKKRGYLPSSSIWSQILWVAMCCHPTILLVAAPTLWTFWAARAIQVISLVVHELRIPFAVFGVVLPFQFFPFVLIHFYLLLHKYSIYIYESFYVCKSVKWRFLTAWIDMQLRK